MALIKSLNTAITGLRAQQARVETVGHNIANVDTPAFKKQRVMFHTLLSQLLSPGTAAGSTFGGIDPIQVGQGIAVAGTQTDWSQGTLKSTGVKTDLAINGDGFFRLRDADGTYYYTRAGAFTLSSENVLHDPTKGYVVQGWGVNDDYELQLGESVGLSVPIGTAPPLARATSEVFLEGNLNANGAIGGSGTQLTSAALFDSRFRNVNLVTAQNPMGLAAATADTPLEYVVRSAGDYISGAGTQLGRAATYINVFPDVQPGSVISVDADKGSRSLPDQVFTYGDDPPGSSGTTLGDFVDFMEGSLGINDGFWDGQLQAEGTYSFRRYSLSGAEVVNGKLQADMTSPTQLKIEDERLARAVRVGDYLRITSGIATGQFAKITAIDSANSTIILEPSAFNGLQALPRKGDTYEINAPSGVRVKSGDTFVLNGTVGDLNPADMEFEISAISQMPPDAVVGDSVHWRTGSQDYSGIIKDIDSVANQIIVEQLDTWDNLSGVVANSTNLDRLFEFTVSSIPEGLKVGDDITYNGGVDTGRITYIDTSSNVITVEQTNEWAGVSGIITDAGASFTLDDPSVAALGAVAGNTVYWERGGTEYSGIVAGIVGTVMTVTKAPGDPAPALNGNVGSIVHEIDLPGGPPFTISKATPVNVPIATDTITVNQNFSNASTVFTFDPSTVSDINVSGSVRTFSIDTTADIDFGIEGAKIGDMLNFVSTAGRQVQATVVGVGTNSLQVAVDTRLGITGSADFDVAAGTNYQIIRPEGGGIEIAGNIGLENQISDVDVTVNNSSSVLFNMPPSQDAEGESVHTAIAIYDSKGEAHVLEATLVYRSSMANGPSRWYYFLESNADVDMDRVVGAGELLFDSSGRFSPASDPVVVSTGASVDINTGAISPLLVDLDFSRLGNLADGRSQMQVFSQDGIESGELIDFAIQRDGLVTGIFSNGLTRTLGQILLSRFDNPGGLVHIGDSYYQTGVNSGSPETEIPMTGGRGEVHSGFLEESNVDLGEQFTELIVGQRAFQANARTITVSDEMLQELVNLI